MEERQLGYTDLVRTTVQLPGALVRKAERAARKMRISRSQLFASAISEYLERLGDDKIAEQLNRIYSREESKLDPALQRAQLESLGCRTTFGTGPDSQ